MRVLVIEDNRNLVANLFDYFEARGHVLDAAPDGVTGLHLASRRAHDVIVLVWMLPGLAGPGVLRRLRLAQGRHTPAPRPTARVGLPHHLAGFLAPAEDYLT